MRGRFVEYATGKWNRALTVFVMAFDVCCGKAALWRNFGIFGGALKQEFYFNINILARIYGRHGIWNCVSKSTSVLPEEIHGEYWPC